MLIFCDSMRSPLLRWSRYANARAPESQHDELAIAILYSIFELLVRQLNKI
ncbi:hypothetical protein [Oxynema sp. CENA135]|uniref:hypothetical protein n=1 Tax=Oxynema sp. CENA135 TaxID=984206 RepID=UPI001F41D0EA|nr:hypothetical protein [Oxynema sp. CENA135]